MAMRLDAITDVPGIRVGHAQDEEGLTGVTVVLCERGAVAAVDQRGGAPGTRETDLLRPGRLVQHVHAVALCGGSVFGLDAAGGVVAWLEAQGAGLATPAGPVPIVPAAVIYDLQVGDARARPGAAMGRAACENARADEARSGNHGAGTGASVGKLLGIERAMKGGVGTASIELGRGVVVGALYAVNAFGDVVDPATCRILAGARVPQRQPRPRHAVGPPRFVDTLEAMRLDPERRGPFGAGESTVIGVVATNARLDRAALGHVAAMAHDGLARAIRPAHTLVDGDTVFALSLGGEHDTDVSVIGAMAAEVTARAIVNAVLHARPAGGLPGCGHTTA